MKRKGEVAAAQVTREDPIHERVLPHNLDAERAVLGALLINPAQYDRLPRDLAPETFFRRAHQGIFRAIRTLVQNKSEADLVTVRGELGRTGEMDEVGGPAYLSALIDGVPRTANAGHYAGMVTETWRRRRLITVANRMLITAYDGPETSADVLATADRALADLQQQGTDRMVDVRDHLADLYQTLAWHMQHAGELLGLDTGYKELNELTSGLQAGDLITVAANPSIGKTVLLLNLAVFAARQQKRVLVCSLEMRCRQIEYRLLAHLSGVALRRIRSGYMGEADLDRLGQAMSTLHDCPIFIDDRGGQSFQDIRSACRRLRAEGGLDLVMIDYVQLVRGTLDRRGATRTEQLDDITLRCKMLADELSCPVIIASQLNRGSANRDDKRPVLSDIKDTSAIGQYSDIVAFLHRKHHREGGITLLILEKQRNGPTGTVKLFLDRDTQTFRDPTPEELTPAAEESSTPASEPKAPRHWKRARSA